MERNLVELTARISRSVQTTIGWIFWDPGAVRRYEELGVPGPLGYVASRAAPLAPAGPDAVIAAFGSISPPVIRWAFDTVTDFDAFWHARNEAVVDGLHAYAAAIVEPLEAAGPELWRVVEGLPTVGRVLFAAHLRMPRPDDPLLSGWHAVNCIREWRGDTHWALVAGRTERHRCVDPAQRVARLRPRLVATVAGEWASGDRVRLDVIAGQRSRCRRRRGSCRPRASSVHREPD